MAAKGNITELPVGEQSEESPIHTFHLRGSEYVVREVTGTEYEENYRNATTDQEDGRQTVDMWLLDKTLTVLSTTRDGAKLDMGFFDSAPYPVTQKVIAEARGFAWGSEAETDEEIKAKGKSPNA